MLTTANLTTDSRTRNQLVKLFKCYSVTYGTNSVINRSISFYNQLPRQLIVESSLGNIKNCVKQYFYMNYLVS